MSSSPLDFNIRIPNIDDASAIACVHAKMIQAAFAGLLPDKFMQTVTVEKRLKIWQHALGLDGGGNHPFVLESNGKIRGFVNCGQPINPLPGFDCEIYTLYVSPADQGLGYGAALFNQACGYLHSAGYSNLILWTLAASPYRAFYLKMGGDEIAERQEDFTGVPVSHIAFGWPLG